MNQMIVDAESLKRFTSAGTDVELCDSVGESVGILKLELSLVAEKEMCDTARIPVTPSFHSRVLPGRSIIEVVDEGEREVGVFFPGMRSDRPAGPPPTKEDYDEAWAAHDALELERAVEEPGGCTLLEVFRHLARLESDETK